MAGEGIVTVNGVVGTRLHRKRRLRVKIRPLAVLTRYSDDRGWCQQPRHRCPIV